MTTTTTHRLIGCRVVAWTGDRSGPGPQWDQHGVITDVYETTGIVQVQWDHSGSTAYRLADLIGEMTR